MAFTGCRATRSMVSVTSATRPGRVMPKTELGFLPDPASPLGAFKTPTLRNVALTAPYMHDRRFTTLKQVLDFYGRGTQANRGHLDQSTPAVRLDARASASVRRRLRDSRTVVMHAPPC